jgi:hypothetical protein
MGVRNELEDGVKFLVPNVGLVELVVPALNIYKAGVM